MGFAVPAFAEGELWSAGAAIVMNPMPAIDNASALTTKVDARRRFNDEDESLAT